MVEAKKEQAQEFINSISSEDKVALITDHDPDGFTSGTLFYDFCKKQKAEIKQFTFTRGITSIDALSLEDYNKIITTDLAASQVAPILEKYQNKKILFMDHHPKDAELPNSIIEYRTIDRGYIPSARSAYELTGGKSWIGLAGTVADVGYRYPENDKFIKTSLKEIETDLETFKTKVVFPISNCILFLNKDPEKAFNLIQNMQTPKDISSIEEYSKPIEDEVRKVIADFERKKEIINGAIFFYFESKYPVKPAINGISLKPGNEENIYLFATTKGDDKISISARSQTKKMNMKTLLKAGIKNIPEAQSGGHFAASGATINKEYLEQFKQNIREFLTSNPIN